MSDDSVTAVLDAWRRERSDLDLVPLGVAGRVGRVAMLVRSAQEVTLESFGLLHGEFDVLASLRRSGEPYQLTPSRLADTMLLSRAAMTSRLDRLERAGLVTRHTDPTNRRSLLITLTESGYAVVDEAVTTHAANTARLLSALAPTELETLDSLLSTLLAGLEQR